MGLAAAIPLEVSNDSELERLRLFGSFIVAGVAAGLAVHESVLAHTYIELRLAEATESFACAMALGAVALRTTVFAQAGSGAHAPNLPLDRFSRNVPLVTFPAGNSVRVGEYGL